MPLKEFLEKNEILLSEHAYLLCQEGIVAMRESRDPLHDVRHVNRMFTELDTFINQVDEKLPVNYEVLLPAICWHDAWRAKRSSKNPLKILYEFVAEGGRSAAMARSHMKKKGIDPTIIKEVSYCIRKHSAVQFRKIKTLEAKILWDIDRIDMWRSDRVRMAYKTIKSNIGLRFLIKRSKILRNNKRLKNYHFTHFAKEHEERFEDFVKTMRKLLW